MESRLKLTLSQLVSARESGAMRSHTFFTSWIGVLEAKAAIVFMLLRCREGRLELRDLQLRQDRGPT